MNALATWVASKPGPFAGRTLDAVWRLAWANFNDGPTGGLNVELDFMIRLGQAGFLCPHSGRWRLRDGSGVITVRAALGCVRTECARRGAAWSRVIRVGDRAASLYRIAPPNLLRR